METICFLFKNDYMSVGQHELLSLAMLLGNVLGMQKNDIIKGNTLMENDYFT